MIAEDGAFISFKSFIFNTIKVVTVVLPVVFPDQRIRDARGASTMDEGRFSEPGS
jgi:hypothetical protein